MSNPPTGTASRMAYVPPECVSRTTAQRISHGAESVTAVSGSAAMLSTGCKARYSADGVKYAPCKLSTASNPAAMRCDPRSISASESDALPITTPRLSIVGNIAIE